MRKNLSMLLNYQRLNFRSPLMFNSSSYVTANSNDSAQSHPSVQKTLGIASRYSFFCKIYSHDESGKSSENAAAALQKDISQIIKGLYIKDNKGNKFAVILRGSDRLDMAKLKEQLTERKPGKLRFASSDEVINELGFEPGGVPVIAYIENGIPTFIDENVVTQELVIGSGGTEFHAMEFDPRQLIEPAIGCVPCRISK